MPIHTATSTLSRQDRLFDLLRGMGAAGADVARVGDVDARIASGRAGLFLKHDVHGLNLDGLDRFARRQADEGLFGTYLFMAPDHPLTAPHYGFARQARSMRSLRDLGHEVGLHIDPYFLAHHAGRPLREVLGETVAAFAAAGVPLAVGNMHGNSRHKHPDLDGRGTMFDLFDELGRQPDFPELSRVPPASAALIRAERVRLADFGFLHWADMPMWSARHGFVVTNFVTDNQLGKAGTVETLVHECAIGGYGLADRQPPGSRSLGPLREAVPVRTVQAPPPAPGGATLPFDSPDLAARLRSLAGHPTLMLIHPEFYCA